MFNQLKYYKGVLFSIFYIPILFLCGYKVQDGKYIVKINVAEKKSPDKLVLSICLFSRSEQELKIPQEQSLVFGYSDDESADCYFEVLEINDSKNIAIAPTADYQYFNTEKKFYSLKKNKSLIYKFDLRSYYALTKDKEYKIRLTFRLSKYGASNNVLTDWLIVKM